MVTKNYTESWIDEYNQYLGAINFTAGDYESLKAAIRDYVVKQNPEGYNDWQESSEVGMFVNAIAYLGQAINYRVDLNVNDLFPSTTGRKQSLLNFTRMLSYSSKRNNCANGLAKLVSVSTTQDVTDASGNLLKNITINWNDSTNEDWLEQFLTIMNSAFSYTNQFGKPTKKVTIDSISNQLYQFNSALNSTCVFPFSATNGGNSYSYEVVNPTINIETNAIEELTPVSERAFNILYRNDGAGYSSFNTGFFVYWKQGTLKSEFFSFDKKIENNYIDVGSTQINDTDVWFEEIDSSTGYVKSVWEKINAEEYLSYNNVETSVKTIYKVQTGENDTITVKFGDGFFADIPYGTYKLWYRISNGNDGLYIKPSDIKNISITLPYYNNSIESDNTIYYLTMTYSVADVSHIRQAVPTESMASIREHAPQVYSTQNRMVTGKDYNYFPKSIGQQLKVLNAVERTYAGNSRFIDINEPTGTYSPVNVLGTDGYLFSETNYVRSSVSLNSNLTAEQIYSKYIESKISLKEVMNLYYKHYSGNIIPAVAALYYYWRPKVVSHGINTMAGEFYKRSLPPGTGNYIADYMSNDLKVGDMICFQEYVYKNGIETLVNNIVWAKVTAIEDDTLVSISEVLDVNKNWKIRKTDDENEWSIIKAFNATLDDNVLDELYSYISTTESQSTFGITYVQGENGDDGHWNTITSEDDPEQHLLEDELNMVSYSPLTNNKVANWIIRITYDTTTQSWLIDTHQTKYVFGSVKQASFYFNTTNRDASNDGYFITKDVIKITETREEDDVVKLYDYYWKPYNVIKYADGYVEPQEFICEAYDSDKDDSIDVPTQYTNQLENMKDLIFLKDEGTEEESDMHYLEYIDLNTIYDVNGVAEETTTMNEESYKCSLWERTLTTGYYYCYHRIKEVIPANGTSIYGTKKVCTPLDTTLIASNGAVITFNGAQIEVTDRNEYDIVDYIKEYRSSNAYQLYYDDIRLLDGTIESAPDVVGVVKNRSDLDSIIGPTTGKVYCVSIDELHDNNTTFYTFLENGTWRLYGTQIHGYLYYYDSETKLLREFVLNEDYEIVKGLNNLTFLWKHYPTEDYIIDPCATNIIDMFVLTSTYYNEVQEWVQGGKSGAFPTAPSAYELKGIFRTLEANKMISDAMVWHPVSYKLVFGPTADTDTHCIFKVIKANDMVSDNEVKKQVIECVDTFFRSMGVGETFYFTQLSTYIENQLSTILRTVVIVPTDTTNKFGNLFQIKCGENEILLSSATLDDVQIISTITSQNIRISS